MTTKPKHGAPQTWNPKITVRIAMTPADAAYFKARMDEYIMKMKAREKDEEEHNSIN